MKHAVVIKRDENNNHLTGAARYRVVANHSYYLSEGMPRVLYNSYFKELILILDAPRQIGSIISPRKEIKTFFA